MSDLSQLLPVSKAKFSGEEQLCVNMRNVHAALGVQTRYNDWIGRRIAQYDFAEHTDYEVLLNSEYNLSGGRPQQDYYFTLGAAKEIAMVENNARGREIRKYFIACEKQLRKAMPNFDDPLEAAKAWVKAEEEKRKAQAALVQEQSAHTATKQQLNQLASVTRQLLVQQGLAGEYRTVKSLSWWNKITVPGLPTGKKGDSVFWAPLGKALVSLCLQAGGLKVPYERRPSTWGEFQARGAWDIMRIADPDHDVINVYPWCAIAAFKQNLINGVYDKAGFARYLRPNYKEILESLD